MEEQKYKNAREAYKAIHCGLSAAIECALENCDYKDAMEKTAMMREIEERHLEVIEEICIDGTRTYTYL